MAWIRIIGHEESAGALRREYDRAIERAGRIYNIVRIQGLRPRHLHASLELYLVAMHGESGLTRAQREMLAVVVSQVNHCHY
jgi:alkylhydroperoxidase family enzyme